MTSSQTSETQQFPAESKRDTRFAKCLPILAQTISDRLIADGHLTHGMEKSDRIDVISVTTACLETVTAMMAGRDPAGPLAVIERFGARCAHGDVPLFAITQVVHRGTHYLLDQLAEARDRSTAIEALQCLFTARTAITASLSCAYVREKAGGAAAPGRITRNVAAALLAGRTPIALAKAGAVTLAKRYWVLAVIFSQAFELAEHAAAWWEKMRETLAQRHPGVLAVVGRRGATVLVPAPHAGENDAHGVAEFIGRVLRQEVHVAVLQGEVSHLPSTANLAHDLARLATQHNLPGGVYRLDDLVLERMLSKPGLERDRLAELVVPLAASAHLLDTVRAHLSTNLNRRRTAKILGVHVNTVDYRITRIQALTGFDIRRSDHLFRLRAALIAYDSARFDLAEAAVVDLGRPATAWRGGNSNAAPR